MDVKTLSLTWNDGSMYRPRDLCIKCNKWSRFMLRWDTGFGSHDSESHSSMGTAGMYWKPFYVQNLTYTHKNFNPAGGEGGGRGDGDGEHM